MQYEFVEKIENNGKSYDLSLFFDQNQAVATINQHAFPYFLRIKRISVGGRCFSNRSILAYLRETPPRRNMNLNRGRLGHSFDTLDLDFRKSLRMSATY